MVWDLGVNVPWGVVLNMWCEDLGVEKIKSGGLLGKATPRGHRPNPKGFRAGVWFLGVGPCSKSRDCKIGCGVGFQGKCAIVCGAEYVV